MAEYFGTQVVGIDITGLEDVPADSRGTGPYLIIGPKVGDVGSMSLVWIFNSEEYSSTIEFGVDDSAFDVLDGIIDLWGAYNYWTEEMFEPVEEDED